MPNFGLKCFLGSFIFSLLAVMAATKGYYVLTKDDASAKPVLAETKAVQNIELYAQNDEADRIYEKFKAISAPSQVQVPLNDEPLENVEDGYDDISDTLAFDGEQTGDIIYEPDDEQSAGEQSKEKEKSAAKMLASDDETIEIKDEDDGDDDELIIADASEAPEFIIPLQHNFGTSTIGGTSVSSSTESAPTAMASQNVKVQADIKSEANSDPWETAVVGNPHVTKNKIAKATQEHKDEVAALDKEKNSEAKAEKETKVAYKMMKNILIPIPDEIANDENLTPQLSYSARNKKN